MLKTNGLPKIRFKGSTDDWVQRKLADMAERKSETGTSGTKMARADWKLISDLEFRAPSSIAEQQKIRRYFFTLDRLILLHQCKCEQLKELKKFMLQNLFPD